MYPLPQNIFNESKVLQDWRSAILKYVFNFNDTLLGPDFRAEHSSCGFDAEGNLLLVAAISNIESSSLWCWKGDIARAVPIKFAPRTAICMYTMYTAICIIDLPKPELKQTLLLEARLTRNNTQELYCLDFSSNRTFVIPDIFNSKHMALICCTVYWDKEEGWVVIIGDDEGGIRKGIFQKGRWTFSGPTKVSSYFIHACSSYCDDNGKRFIVASSGHAGVSSSAMIAVLYAGDLTVKKIIKVSKLINHFLNILPPELIAKGIKVIGIDAAGNLFYSTFGKLLTALPTDYSKLFNIIPLDDKPEFAFLKHESLIKLPNNKFAYYKNNVITICTDIGQSLHQIPCPQAENIDIELFTLNSETQLAVKRSKWIYNYWLRQTEIISISNGNPIYELLDGVIDLINLDDTTFATWHIGSDSLPKVTIWNKSDGRRLQDFYTKYHSFTKLGNGKFIIAHARGKRWEDFILNLELWQWDSRAKRASLLSVSHETVRAEMGKYSSANKWLRLMSLANGKFISSNKWGLKIWDTLDDNITVQHDLQAVDFFFYLFDQFFLIKEGSCPFAILDGNTGKSVFSERELGLCDVDFNTMRFINRQLIFTARPLIPYSSPNKLFIIDFSVQPSITKL